MPHKPGVSHNTTLSSELKTMMIETSVTPVSAPTMEASSEAPVETSAEASSTTGGEPSHETPAPAPAPAPAPRKTWGVPKAPPKGSEPKKKKSLMEIMEEEQKAEQAKKEADEANIEVQQKQLEQRLMQEEEAALMRATQASMAASEPGAMDDMDEDMKLALMLSMQDQPQSDAKLPPSEDTKMPPVAASASAVNSSAYAASAAASSPVVVAAAASAPFSDNNGLTEEEMKEIEKALMEADAAESAKTDAESLRLALELQNEEDGKMRAKQNLKKGPQGNVRTMSRADFLREKGEDRGDDYHNQYEEDDHARYMDEYDDLEENGAVEAGYRINSTKQSAWARADGGGTIRGHNGELKTKHDTKLQGQANAYRLELCANDTTGNRAHVGNKAFNDFHRSMQKKTVKGVAAHGHGRATADADKTRDGALDGRVRLQIARAVNNGLIEAFHGCVKEGKEALVFHAQQGANSEGFDVAVKVFKRISEFRNRRQYVAGDPRYKDGKDFKYAGARQQVELWAEKENRNLLRAYRAKVPVPKPLWYKENVLFLRFLGEEGWPSPQLRELDMKKGSKKWTALYEQTMESMQLLYCDARLVHGDLSEYNIMVCPERFLQRFDDDEDVEEDDDTAEKKPAAAVMEQEDPPQEEEATEKKPAVAAATETKEPATTTSNNQESEAKPAAKVSTTEPSPAKGTGDALQVALIDFGQAVDLRHPEAVELLRRDITRVKEFFDRQAITTVSVEAAMVYVQTKGASLR